MPLAAWSRRLAAPRRCLPLATVLAFLLAMAAAAGTTAAPVGAAAGTFTTTSAVRIPLRTADGNTILDLAVTLAYTGTLAGTSVTHGILIFHPDGTANFHDVETFTGTVDGVPGTLTLNLTGTGDLVAGTVVGHQTIVGATGALAGLHGVLRQAGQVLDPAQGPFGTYSGQIH